MKVQTSCWLFYFMSGKSLFSSYRVFYLPPTSRYFHRMCIMYLFINRWQQYTGFTGSYTMRRPVSTKLAYQLTLPSSTCKVTVRPAMLYGLETVALTKRQEAEMEVAELKMLPFSLGVTRMDNIINGYIRGTAQVGRFGKTIRDVRLRWFWHVRMEVGVYIGITMLTMELPGNRKRGRPKRRYRMRWERTWQWLKWRRSMQKIGTSGDRESYVATSDGRNRMVSS